MFLEPKTSPFNKSPIKQVVTNLSATQLVTTSFVRELLKREVLGWRNAERTNNLHEECLGLPDERLKSVLCRTSLEPTKGCYNKNWVRRMPSAPTTYLKSQWEFTGDWIRIDALQSQPEIHKISRCYTPTISLCIVVTTYKCGLNAI